MASLSSVRRTKLLSSAVFVLLSALSNASPVQAAGASFFEDFDTLDPLRWRVSDGWTNGGHQNCGWSDKRAIVNNGMLELWFGPGLVAERLYSCGEVRTREAYKYGTYEARLRTPTGSGINAAFFTYTGPTKNQPHDEIDFEILTKDTSKVSMSTWLSGETRLVVADLPQKADRAFIDYAFVWTAESVKFYANGELLHTVDALAEIPTHEQNIFFSLWGTDTLGEWMGVFEPPAEPIKMEIDWFGYTAPGDSCVFPASMTC